MIGRRFRAIKRIRASLTRCAHSIAIASTSKDGENGPTAMSSGSGWTVETLRTYLETIMNERMDRLDERYATQTRALDAAFLSQQTAVQAAMDAAEKAVGKAEVAAEKRFDAVNEFRGQLSDIITTFIPRNEAELAIGRNAERIQELVRAQQDNITRGEVENAVERNNERFQDLADRVNVSSGKGLGQSAVWAGIMAVLTLAVLAYAAFKP